MPKRRRVVYNLFHKYVENTLPKVIVANDEVYVCRLTEVVLKEVNFFEAKVYLNTKVLKHLYDRKPAEEFDFVVRHLHLIIKYPDRLYKNKISKSGDYCLVKKIENYEYLCSLQCLTENEVSKIMVVTIFRIRDEKYLKNYELLWSWKGGVPSS